MSEVHAQARTTPRTRAEIKNSTASLLELAKRYNISVATARKWKQRDSPEDLSHRPHKLCTTLTPAQEAIAVAVRSLTLLGLDDLVAVVREFINPRTSHALDWIAACVAMAWPICVNYKPRRWLMPARLSHRSKPSRIMNLASCTWISSTCRGCLTRNSDVTCL